MATNILTTVFRPCSKCRSNIASLLKRQPYHDNLKLICPRSHIINSSNSYAPTQLKILHPRTICTATRVCASHQTSDTVGAPGENDLPQDFEVSYDEFKYVERVLPSLTVPELKEDAQYPSPSGWFPPNESLQAQQKFLVRRTKNHMLPVYPVTQHTWHGTTHHVVIRKIEGDIWALEAELRDLVQQSTGQNKVTTQVHEVGRFIRVRGQHRDLIAQFLLDRGM